MSVSGLEAWKAPENQSKNSQNQNLVIPMLTAKKTKNHRARLEGLILPETWGRYQVWGVPFTPFCGKKRPNMTPPTARPRPTAAGASPTSPGEHNGRLVRWECQLLEPDGIWIHMKSYENEAPRWTSWRCEDANPNFEDMNLRKLPWEWIMGKDDMMSLDAVMEMANWTFEMQVFKLPVLGCPFLKTKCFPAAWPSYCTFRPSRKCFLDLLQPRSYSQLNVLA